MQLIALLDCYLAEFIEVFIAECLFQLGDVLPGQVVLESELEKFGVLIGEAHAVGAWNVLELVLAFFGFDDADEYHHVVDPPLELFELYLLCNRQPTHFRQAIDELLLI